MKLFARTPWKQQPQRNSVAQPGWERVYNFAQQNNAVTEGNSFTRGSSVMSAGRAGMGLRVTDDGQSSTGEIVPGISTAITVVWIAEKIAAIAALSNFVLGEASTAAGPYNYGFYESVSTGQMSCYVHNGTTGVSCGGSAAWAAGAGPQVWCMTYGGGDDNVRLYLNGEQVASAAQTGSIQRNSGAHLSNARWQAGNPNFREYAAAVSSRRLTAQEVFAKFGSVEKAWGNLFQPLGVDIGFSPPAGGTTITGAIGTAVASGLTGTVNANRTLAGALGTATASGLQGVVNANRAISGALGTAVAIGLVGNVNVNRTIAGALGTATASGFQGTVTNGNTTTIAGSLGTAVATGFTGGVTWNRYIAGVLGVATASGFTGGVANGTAAPAQEGGGWMPPQGRRKTRKEVYAERVKLGILPPAIVRAAEKVAVVAETVQEFKAERPRYEEMFMRELNVTKWSPSYTRAIQIQIELMQQDDEDILLLMM